MYVGVALVDEGNECWHFIIGEVIRCKARIFLIVEEDVFR